jgi:hypothetical protein
LLLYLAKPQPHRTSQGFGPGWELIRDQSVDCLEDFVGELKSHLNHPIIIQFFIEIINGKSNGWSVVSSWVSAPLGTMGIEATSAHRARVNRVSLGN